jgi:hypothetical protein
MLMLQSSARCVALEEHNEDPTRLGLSILQKGSALERWYQARTIMPIPDEDEGVRIKVARKLLLWLEANSDGAVNLSGRVSRMQALAVGSGGYCQPMLQISAQTWNFWVPGSSVLGGSDVIAGKVEEVVNLIVG